MRSFWLKNFDQKFQPHFSVGKCVSFLDSSPDVPLRGHNESVGQAGPGREPPRASVFHVPEVHVPEVHVPEVHVPEVHVPEAACSRPALPFLT